MTASSSMVIKSHRNPGIWPDNPDSGALRGGVARTLVATWIILTPGTDSSHFHSFSFIFHVPIQINWWVLLSDKHRSLTLGIPNLGVQILPAEPSGACWRRVLSWPLVGLLVSQSHTCHGTGVLFMASPTVSHQDAGPLELLKILSGPKKWTKSPSVKHFEHWWTWMT